MNRNDDIEFGLLSLVNLLPLLGFFVFDWEFIVLGLLYWLDAALLLVVYSGYALFAQPENRVEEREYTLLPGTVANDYWSENPRTVAGFLPPVYTRNLRVIIPTVLFVGGFVMVAIGSSWLAGDRTIGGRGGAGDLFEFLSAFSAFTSPVVLGIAFAIFATHVLTLYRRYVRHGRHEELSAYMTLELPVRFVLVYASAFPLLLFYALLVAVLTDPVLPVWAFDLLWAGSFLAVKLSFERARLRAEVLPDPGGYAAWFTPSDPSETVELSGRIALRYVATLLALLVAFVLVAFSSSR
ncbi:DUF6498-containing protein [Halorussus halobius]|uniref:DUF6498-containing protein n=1 Tax=Halorussus halobius TaxID=1710537 RepID=UPI0010920195|nr:DUF6498-containing protein [Halorussus halobius]